jgi:magnesium chelatase subunit D
MMSFSAFVGQERAKLALILNAIDSKCGGVLFVGERGCGKSSLMRCFPALLPPPVPFVEFPLNATEEAVLGGINLESTIRSGTRCMEKSLLQRAAGGFVYIDDINLLPGEILSLVLYAQDRSALAVLPSHTAGIFQLIASMCADNPLSPHALDRFGMAVAWQHVDDPLLRKQVILTKDPSSCAPDKRDGEIRSAIAVARQRLASIHISEAIEEKIADHCAAHLVAGHRADIFFYYAARAYAALEGHAEVTQEDLEVVLPLVLEHRQREAQPQNQSQEQQSDDHQKNSETPEQSSQQDQSNAAQDHSSQPQTEEQDGEDNKKSSRSLPAQPKEQVFDVGDPFSVRRMQFLHDRMKRGSAGRKVKTLSRDKRGRYVKSIERGLANDIAIDATIRAAAPWQKARGAKQTLIIRGEDILFKQREKRIGHLTVFVVDGSGSMGAQQRMVAAKGAIQSLLLDSYQKRDKVAMIVFRRDHAELVLPPTSSVQLASHFLQQIPVGGKTPLGAGLQCAYDLLQRMRLKSAETRFLVTLITDGKANHSMSELSPAEEAKRMTFALKQLPSTEFIVIDTENKSSFVRTGNAGAIAVELNAQYFRMDELRAENIAAAVLRKVK